MNLSRRFFPSGRAGFTLVELLVSTAIIALIMLVLLGMTNQISQTWRATTGKIEQFQEARDGFESMTRKLSQATLNTYLDLTYTTTAGQQIPQDYFRQSQLRFISGPMARLAPATLQPTHGVFFQAPLGFVEDGQTLGHMENLLNTWGYFIEIADDTASRPPFITQGMVPTRWRSRLMELMQPAESMSVYDLDPKGAVDANGNPQPVSGDQLRWFKPAIAIGATDRPVRVLAENIVALIIWPKLSKQEEDARRDAGKSPLSPNYLYDSSLLSFSAGNLNEGAVGTGTDAAQINPKNQLPPIVQVTMVALDELSATRFHGAQGDDAPLALVKDLFEVACAVGTRANQETQYEQDIQEMEQRMVAAKLTYRIFTTNLSIRGAKWSAFQTR